MFAVAFLYLCFTATMFLGSLLLTKNHYPLFVAGFRFFASGLMLLSLYFHHHKKIFWHYIPQLHRLDFYKYSFCLYTFSAIGYAWGMQYVDSVKACFVFVLAPFITALLLYVLEGHVLTQKKLYGLLIGFASVSAIILQSDHGVKSSADISYEIAGYVVFALATIAFAYGWILNKRMHVTVHVPSGLLTGAALFVGGSTTLVFWLCFENKAICSMQVTDDFWWLLLLFAMITGISYNLYSALLKRYSATFVSFASFLEPAFGLVYGAIFLAKPISYLALCSLLGLGSGLYLFYQEELRLQ